MISFKELIRDYTLADIPMSHQINLQDLLKRVNIVRAKYGKPMTVTSGYRTHQDHVRIYNQKGVSDLKLIPMGSRHLSGQAVDIADADGALKKWLELNVTTLEAAGLYCEDFAHTKTWVHFQNVPPKSGKRFFIP